MSIKKGIELADSTPKNNLSNHILKFALAYVNKLNWPIFPLWPKSKRPIHEGGFHNATTNIEQIKAWWTEHPEAGIGLPTGKASGVIVVDIDPRNGGHISFERLIDEFGDLPHTVECLTGGGGKHIYLAFDERISKTKLDGYPGVDIQINGKYVVLPPSIHPNGNKYMWEQSSKPVLTPIAKVPKWLTDMVAQPKEMDLRARPYPHWLNILKGVREGNRNNAATSLVGYLLRHLHPYVAVEITYMWNERNNPPLDEKELQQIINSVAGMEERRRA